MTNIEIAKNLLQTTLYDHNAPPPEDQTVFRMNFKRIGSLGDYILITGKKSSGKTKYVAGAISAAITRQEVFNFQIKLPVNKNKVFHIDSEQGKVSHRKMIELILKLSSIDQYPANFQSHRCRCVAPHLILLMVEHYLKLNPDCGMIFLDGMLDTVESINDEKVAARMKRWMQEISEEHNILIAGVIHRGFSADKAIGHLGSYLERGAQTVFAIEKKIENNFSQYIIRTEYIRDDAPPDETAIYFNTQTECWEKCDSFSEPEIKKGRGVRQQRPGEYDIAHHVWACGQIFNSQTTLSYNNLINEIKIAYGIGDNLAKTDFYKHLIREGLIFKTEDGYTREIQAKLFIVKNK
mgnify:CR=1 FL=1